MPHGVATAQSVILRVKELADDGLSMQEIGDRMGLTRSAVAGLIKRWRATYQIKLIRKSNMARKGQRSPRKRRRTAIKPPPTPPREEVLVDPIPENACDFWSLTVDRCRYAVTEGRAPYLFCGMPKDPARPYCDFHYRLCVREALPIPMHVATRHYNW